MPLLVLLALLAGAPWAADLCEALNVTVSPGPRTQHLIGDNVTLFCHVSQKRRRENLLAVRWVFALPSAQEYLMIKMTKFGVVQYYGNYTSRFYKRRLRLLEEKHRTMYAFLILNIQQAEQGHYICKVQEIGKQRNKWTSWSNGSASTEVQVFPSRFLDEEKHNAWAFFEDLSVYAALMCSAGILSILLFTLVILCQILSNKKRAHGKRNLMKSPQKSVQESGSPSKAAGSLGAPAQRKGAKATQAPPAVPAKGKGLHSSGVPCSISLSHNFYSSLIYDFQITLDNQQLFEMQPFHFLQLSSHSREDAEAMATGAEKRPWTAKEAHEIRRHLGRCKRHMERHSGQLQGG